MSEVDDIWQPLTETERKILQSMKTERESRLLTIGSYELKEIKVAYQNYKQLGPVRGSDLDLELMLNHVRPMVEVFEKKAQEPGEYQDFCRGIMNACYGFLRQIICMHEAKKKVKQDLLEEAKQEVRDRERENRL